MKTREEYIFLEAVKNGKKISRINAAANWFRSATDRLRGGFGSKEELERAEKAWFSILEGNV